MTLSKTARYAVEGIAMWRNFGNCIEEADGEGSSWRYLRQVPGRGIIRLVFPLTLKGGA